MAGKTNLVIAGVVALGLAGAAYYFLSKQGDGGGDGGGGGPPGGEPPPTETPKPTVSNFDTAYDQVQVQ